MRTSTIAVALGLAVLLVGALQTISASGPETIDASAYRMPDADKQRLSTVVFGVPPTEAVSPAKAMAVVGEQYHLAALGAEADAYLETVTLTLTLRGDRPVLDRPFWIVRLSGFEFERPAPIGADGNRVAPSHYLHVGYVFVDARTGEFLMTEWQE